MSQELLIKLFENNQIRVIWDEGKDGKVPINITITLNGERASFSTHKMVSPADCATGNDAERFVSQMQRMDNLSADNRWPITIL